MIAFDSYSFCFLDTCAIHERMLDGEIVRQFSVTVFEEDVREADLINMGLSSNTLRGILRKQRMLGRVTVLL